MNSQISCLESEKNGFSDQKNPQLDPKIIKIGSEMAEIDPSFEAAHQKGNFQMEFFREKAAKYAKKWRRILFQSGIVAVLMGSDGWEWHQMKTIESNFHPVLVSRAFQGVPY